MISEQSVTKKLDQYMFAAQYRGIDDVHTHEEERRLPMARSKKTISRPYRTTVRFTDMEYGLITDAAEET